MSTSYPPRSLRFSETTEAKLKVFSQLRGQPVSTLIQDFVREGLAEALQPALFEAHAQRVNDMAAQLGIAVRLEVVQEPLPPEAPQI